MGPEPYIAAQGAGADIVLGGWTTDTAVLAAVAIVRGAGVSPSWHAGRRPVHDVASGWGVMIRVGREAFEIEPLASESRCTPQTVSSHMLYENCDPLLPARLMEAAGMC